jgi:tetratricopeptide (TPR) repeat protein
MNKKISFIFILLLIAMVSTLQALQPGDMKTLERARSYASSGRVDEALKLLEPLMSMYPNDPRLLATAFEIYRDAKDYDRALNMLDRRRKINTDGGRIFLDYADIYLKTTQLDSAKSALQKYLNSQGGGSRAYMEISQAYLKNGYYGEATQTYLDGREKLQDTMQFAMELGALYQRQRQYYEAAREFFKFMRSDTIIARTGEAQLNYLIDNSDEPGEIERAFKDIIAADSSNYQAYRFYADLMVRKGEFDSAFENYKKADRFHQKDGRHLLRFSDVCLEQHEYAMAAEACRYLAVQYRDKGYYFMAQMNLAKAFVAMNQADSAAQIYHQILDSRLDPRSKLEGEYFLGCLFLEHLYETDSARFYFNRLIKADPNQGWTDKVRIKIAESYIVDNQLDIADSIFLAVNTNRLRQEDKEVLLFERAQIKFFKKEYSDAKGLYNLLIAVHPRSMYVNDCLRKVLIIDENQGINVIDLDLYADAERLLYQNHADSALTSLIDLSGRGDSNISAMATFTAGEIYYQKADYQNALEYFNKVLSGFEESFYSAESQKYLGDLYFYHLNDREKAKEAYRVILENYPNKVLYEYARRQLRKLESS